MKTPDLALPVSPKLEQAALTSHIRSHWHGVGADLRSYVARVYSASEHLAAAWFEPHPVWRELKALESHRRARLVNSLADPRAQAVGPRYDSVHRQLVSMSRHLKAFQSAGMGLRSPDHSWSFATESEKLSRYLEQSHPWSAFVRPKAGPHTPRGTFRDDLLLGESLFEGHDFTAIDAYGFVGSTQASQVAWNEAHYGWPPDRTLANALFSHCLELVAHNNTSKILGDLQGLGADRWPGKVVFGRRLRFRDPILIALSRASRQIDLEDPDFCKSYTPKEYAEELASASDSAPAPNFDEVEAMTRELLHELQREHQGKEAEQKQAREAAICRHHLQGQVRLLSPGGRPRTDSDISPEP